MDIQNRTIGDLLDRGEIARWRETEDPTILFTCAQFLFSHQIFLRFPNITDVNQLDERTVETIARLAIGVSPLFTHVWNETTRETRETTRPRREERERRVA